MFYVSNQTVALRFAPLTTFAIEAPETLRIRVPLHAYCNDASCPHRLSGGSANVGSGPCGYVCLGGYPTGLGAPVWPDGNVPVQEHAELPGITLVIGADGGTLTTAGLPLLDSLRITRDTLGNTAMMNAIDEVELQVTEGKPLADPLERSGLFPPLLVQVVNLGERSGKLETMLLHAATAFDRQVNVSIKIVTKALPPLLIVIMACLAGFVLAAILLPLLEMQALMQ